MKHLIIVSISDNEFDGRMYEDGENRKYDAYMGWMNGTEAGCLIGGIKDILKEWDENPEIDGGSLMNPNGVIFWADTLIPADMADAVRQYIDVRVQTQFDLFASSSPVGMKYSVSVEEA